MSAGFVLSALLGAGGGWSRTLCGKTSHEPKKKNVYLGYLPGGTRQAKIVNSQGEG